MPCLSYGIEGSVAVKFNLYCQNCKCVKNGSKIKKPDGGASLKEFQNDFFQNFVSEVNVDFTNLRLIKARDLYARCVI